MSTPTRRHLEAVQRACREAGEPCVPVTPAERRRLHGVLDAAESGLRAGAATGLCGALHDAGDVGYILRSALPGAFAPNPEDPFASENFWWPAARWSYRDHCYRHRHPHRSLTPRLIVLDLLRLWVDGELELVNVANFRPRRGRTRR